MGTWAKLLSLLFYVIMDKVITIKDKTSKEQCNFEPRLLTNSRFCETLFLDQKLKIREKQFHIFKTITFVLLLLDIV